MNIDDAKRHWHAGWVNDSIRWFAPAARAMIGADNILEISKQRIAIINYLRRQEDEAN